MGLTSGKSCSHPSCIIIFGNRRKCLPIGSATRALTRVNPFPPVLRALGLVVDLDIVLPPRTTVTPAISPPSSNAPSFLRHHRALVVLSQKAALVRPDP